MGVHKSTIAPWLLGRREPLHMATIVWYTPGPRFFKSPNDPSLIAECTIEHLLHAGITYSAYVSLCMVDLSKDRLPWRHLVTFKLLTDVPLFEQDYTAAHAQCLQDGR